MKRTISLVLFIAMLLTLAACATGTDDNPDTKGKDETMSAGDTQSSPVSSETETIPPDEVDELGDVTFDNETFTILSRKSTAYEISSTDLTGNIVSDAIFERHTEIEERFKVKLNIVTLDGDWAHRESFMAQVNNAVLAETGDYDLVMTHSAYIVNIALAGNGYDMAKLEQIDFSKKWWCYKYVENASMFGKYYTAIGDIGYTLYQYMVCVFFNKTLAANVGLPDLYELVEKGEWTFDKMREFSLLIGDDLNGDGIYNESDRYGIGFSGHNCRLTATLWDAGLTTIDSNGMRKINVPNEKYLNIYEQLYDFIYNNQKNVHYRADGPSLQTTMFINDQLLFYPERLYNAEQMKDMKSEYGIVPFPKYDLSQEEYISTARDALSAILVVKGIKNPEMVGTVTEALCMLGRQKITPAYYENTLKYRYLNDPVAMKMLDLIRDALTFEFACTYTNSLDLIFSTLGDNMNNKVASIASVVQAKSKLWQKQLDNLYATFEKLN